MIEMSPNERISAVISKMIGRDYTPTLIGRFHPFPTESPSKHENIRAFKADMKSLENFHAGLSSVWSALGDLSDAQKIRLNTTAKKAALRMDGVTPEKIAGLEDALLALKGTLSLLAHSIEEETALLKYQKEMFWSGKGIKKNYHAYFIADTLAKIYVKELKEKPSYGINYRTPSGKYCLALQEILEIMEIKIGFLLPAKAACNKITNADIARAKMPKHLPFSPFAPG